MAAVGAQAAAHAGVEVGRGARVELVLEDRERAAGAVGHCALPDRAGGGRTPRRPRLRPQYELHELNVAGYHIFNLLIHLLNALLVYGLMILTFKTPICVRLSSEGCFKASDPYRWIPLFTALLFVSHPIQTQAVTYIVQRFASLSTLFYLVSLVTYIKARGSDASKKSKICVLYGVDHFRCPGHENKRDCLYPAGHGLAL